MTSETSPEDQCRPATQDELRQFLADNFGGPKRALSPVGGRTALDFGYPLSKPVVSVETANLNRVVDFPARDMTVTVEAGIRIARLTEILKAEGQRLAVDVAQPERATLGGAVATNTSGPRRFAYGTLRDYVIGLTAMTAAGREFHSGGRVVKNVAGYDLCKLLVGSMGTLAVVTQVTLKLRPICESSLFVWASFENGADLDGAVGDLGSSGTRPVAIETLNAGAAAAIESQAKAGLPTHGKLLLVGFEGSERESEWQANTLGGELERRKPGELGVTRGAAVGRLWSALTEFPADAAGGVVTFQVELLPSQVAPFLEQTSHPGIATLCHAGDGTVIGKVLGEGAGEAAAALESLADRARRLHGRIFLLRGAPDRLKPVTNGTDSIGSLRLMKRLKQAFDPEVLLNPGRLFPASVPV